MLPVLRSLAEEPEPPRICSRLDEAVLVMRIAVISDTHGKLRPEVLSFLEGADFILHAGDVGKDGIISQLQAVAPVGAVRGNVDSEQWAEALPCEAHFQFLDGVLRIYMTHKWQDVPEVHDHSPPNLIIIGHSHKPELIMLPGGALKLNPGSCGPKRFKLPVCAALIHLQDRHAAISIHDILQKTILMEWSGTLHAYSERPGKDV